MRRIALVVGWFFLVGTALAAPNVSGLFVDNVVLQREMPVPVWGTADPGEKITVAFAGQTVVGVADAQGKWQVELAPLKASSKGRELTVSGRNADQPITVKNVVVGEVWILSGQSNMQWLIQQTGFFGLDRTAANYPLIREVLVNRETSLFPLGKAWITGDRWIECGPATVGNFSATGFFFGRRLFEELEVPIGLLNASLGGTRIEPWIPPEALAGDPSLAANAQRSNQYNLRIAEGRKRFLEKLDERSAWEAEAREAVAAGRLPPREPEPTFRENVHRNQRDATLFNSMIYPLAPYAIRGVIWYQGENNGGDDYTYFVRKKALINGWRELWGQPPSPGSGVPWGEFPFYYAQISSIHQPSDNPAGGGVFVPVRNAQLRSLAIPNTGMAVTIDINEKADLHPENKVDVGERLALWALANDYGRDIECSGPIYREHKVDGNRITLFFDHIGGGLMVGKKEGLQPTQEVADGELKHFAIAGADMQWHWGHAVIDGDTVAVSCPEVSQPIAVRYAYAANPATANLYNRAGLPASPFTTQGYDEKTKE